MAETLPDLRFPVMTQRAILLDAFSLQFRSHSPTVGLHRPRQPRHPAPLLSPSPTEDVENPPAKFQVAVLIAMPSPYRPQSWASVDQDATRTTHVEHHGTCSTRDNLDSEEDLPDVVFGVAEVPWNVREDDRTPPNE